MEALCRICHEEGTEAVRRPCRCRGSVGGVHESCLMQWIDVREGEEEARSRCELCGTAYVFDFDRPTESVADAQSLCETIWGNIGAHIAFQHLLVILLTANLQDATVSVRDIQLFQALYHGFFLLAMAACVCRQLQGSLKVYMWHLLTTERTLYVTIYLGMWINVLWGDYTHWFTIANTIGIQTYPPLIPYFHKKTLEDMNKTQQRVLLDWPGEEQRGGRGIVRGIARGREEI